MLLSLKKILKKNNKWTKKKKKLKRKVKQTKRGTTDNKTLFTSQVEILSGNCSEWSVGSIYIPCPTVAIVKWYSN